MDDAREPEALLVSACLLGRACTYRGDSNLDEVLRRELEQARAEGARIVPFCPEEAGGLATPRPPADLTGNADEVLDGRARVVTHGGVDVTEQFVAGAHRALAAAQEAGVTRAVLKERSPSCGCAATHVAGELVEGPGVTAALLRRSGIRCEGAEGRRTLERPDRGTPDRTGA
ncbi:MAG: DUF523 domain-containing protein [Planctomycetota bacterium]